MLLGLKNLRLRLGSTQLLDDASLAIDEGDRLCLVGRNGTGKSTLLKVIAGEQAPDAGEVIRAQGLRIAQLPQEVPAGIAGSVYDAVAEGLGEVGRLIAAYHHALEDAEPDMKRLGRLQTALEAADGWALQSRVEAAISRVGLLPDVAVASLSGGLKRRTLLARAIVAEPDLLLLDEPTNHLDIEAIGWLEDFLSTFRGALLFISHDRRFVRRLATRVADLDRGRLSVWEGGFESYLRGKEEALHAEARQNALFDKKLAQEEAWIRKGVEARRTRSAGRVKALMQLRETYRNRRNLQGEARMVMQEAERSGRLVAELRGVSHAFGGAEVIRNFSTTILRGDKIGIIGPNGAGKTTLLNILLGKLAPSKGEVRLGTNLQIGYYDQLRSPLEQDQPAFEYIGQGQEYVEINGARKHVMGYLQDFLFAPDRARSPVRALSGGERNRLMLARLFARPSNLMVLDEPTNDLDLETLELLEELLIDYQGTVLLVSHDREFLDNVVTRSLAFEGGGRIGDYVGGYEDWLRQRPESAASTAAPKPAAGPVAPATPASPASSRPGLGVKEQRELDALPGRIAKLEDEQTALAARLSEPDFHSLPAKERDRVEARLAAIAAELAERYARWEQLEDMR